MVLVSSGTSVVVGSVVVVVGAAVVVVVSEVVMSSVMAGDVVSTVSPLEQADTRTISATETQILRCMSNLQRREGRKVVAPRRLSGGTASG